MQARRRATSFSKAALIGSTSSAAVTKAVRVSRRDICTLWIRIRSVKALGWREEKGPGQEQDESGKCEQEHYWCNRKGFTSKNI